MTDVAVAVATRQVVEALEIDDAAPVVVSVVEVEVGIRPGPQLARIFPELGSNIDHPANTVAANAPVLSLEEVGYSDSNQPIWHSPTWFPAGAMNMELIRHPPTPFF